MCAQVDDYEVAYVSGVIHIDPESDLPVLERVTLADATAAPAPTAPEPAGEDAAMDDLSATVVAAEPSPVDPDEDKKPAPDADADSSILPALKPSLFIGDLRLALLKERLAALHVPSEFTGEGILVCGPAPPEAFGFDFSAAATRAGIDVRKGAKFVRDALLDEAMEVSGGRCAVRKVGRGRLVIEGAPGETYYVVRRAVYALHAQAG